MIAAAVDIAVAAAPYAGERASGDAAVVRELGGATLVAAIDGLGHGPLAAAAARAVAGVLETAAPEPLQELMRRCHLAAAPTRGAAVTVALLEGPQLSWLAVGNVAGVLVRAAGRRETVVARAGTLGAALPTLRPAELELEDGDTLVLATDGVASGFAAAVSPAEAPGACAERLLRDWGRGTDDALVLVARYAEAA